MPLVSVIIPVYNGSDYVAEAIHSALGQTHRDVEVIVINDGSKDDGKTERAVREFLPQVRYIAKENGGVASALNRGIEEAKGEYISWLSHDDAFEIDKLEKQLAFIGGFDPAYRERAVVHGDVWFMDESSRTNSRSQQPFVSPDRFYEALICGKVIHSLLKWDFFFMNGCTALFPRAAFERNGRFNEKLRTTQDYDMWFRMNRNTDFILGPGPVLRSRIHKGQGTHTMRKEMLVEVDELYLSALDMYEPGGRFDLDLARTAYALKMDFRRKRAYKRAFDLAMARKKSISDAKFLMGALLYNKGFSIARMKLESLKRRSKEREAAKVMKDGN